MIQYIRNKIKQNSVIVLPKYQERKIPSHKRAQSHKETRMWWSVSLKWYLCSGLSLLSELKQSEDYCELLQTAAAIGALEIPIKTETRQVAVPVSCNLRLPIHSCLMRLLLKFCYSLQRLFFLHWNILQKYFPDPLLVSDSFKGISEFYQPQVCHGTACSVRV